MKQIVAGSLLVLFPCIASCTGSDAPRASTASAQAATAPDRELDARDVTSAPVLSEGSDFKIVVDPPVTVGGSTVNYLGLISPNVAFGKTSDIPTDEQDEDSFAGDSVIMTDLTTKKTTFITRATDRKSPSYVIGMDFSKDYVTWSETPSESPSSQPWVIYSLDRSTNEVRTLARSDDVGIDDPPWLPPYGVVPKIYQNQVYFIAADSNNLPATATAYAVPLDGSQKMSRAIGNVQGVFTDKGGIKLIRDGEFATWNPATKKEKRVDPLKRSSAQCPGVSGGGVIVECESTTSGSRLTIIEADGRVSEINFPRDNGQSNNAGLGYFGASSTWVTFTFDDKAYVYNLRSGKLGRFDGAQYIVAGPSWGNTIRYAKLWNSPTDRKPAPFIQLLK